jgi:hypothetical protein
LIFAQRFLAALEIFALAESGATRQTQKRFIEESTSGTRKISLGN